MICSGQDPAWDLTITDTVANLAFERSSELTIMQDDTALNADHTRALTLVGPRDSAILITTTASCGTSFTQATLLTQRGQSPLVLTGCCEIQPR